MTEPSDVLAQIAAFYASLPAEQGRITRITIAPGLRPWLRGLFPPATETPLGTPGGSTFGIPIVEDPQFVNGRLRIHRGDATEDWFAVPPDRPERLVEFKDPVEFPLEMPAIVPYRPDDTLAYRVTVSRPGGLPLPPGSTVTIEPASGPVRADWHARRPWWRRIWRRR